MTRAISHDHAGQYQGTPYARVTLAHDERHLRRKLLTLENGDQVLADLPSSIVLAAGDVLVLEDGRLVEVAAAREALYEITAKSQIHLAKLCWHLGNRHLPAEITETCIYIQRDHVIRDMLSGLGATIVDVTRPFSPERGAYHSHDTTAHGHHHG
ncbi:urease accessory protein UreE [Mariluticola halotolerans]|uniref:urease accessory protein UreE n=1 Tax=Mariluticola halotolerans TaxID=2909283 RepID=UPI0026E25723|nr:urease accessory protein UreE [Mariluticola halotolerans]UJQ94556.1 urease accessory protein UreE [Mariluticola halotolerans]